MSNGLSTGRTLLNVVVLLVILVALAAGVDYLAVWMGFRPPVTLHPHAGTPKLRLGRRDRPDLRGRGALPAAPASLFFAGLLAAGLPIVLNAYWVKLLGRCLV